MLNTKFNALFLFFFLILASCKLNLETKVFELSDSSYSAIKLFNHSNQSTTFYLNLNEDFPLSKTKIINKINEVSVTYDIAIPIAAWKYVAEITSNTIPISPENWIHDPIIYLNSIGEGFCDDQAAVLAIIWEWLGYQSRVWELNGHVVPEIKYNGKWHMLDPDYEIFYLNDEREIASVEELSSDTSLITDPKFTSPIIEMLNTKLSPNSEEFLVKNSCYMSNLYCSKEDNKINTSLVKITDSNHNLFFVLPSYAKLEFPIQYKDIDSGAMKTILKLTLYKHESDQKCKIPLILFRTKGQSKIKIRKKNVYLKRGANRNISLNNFNTTLKVKEIQDSVELFYLVNPYIFNEIDSTIKLSGKNIESLTLLTN
jgi:hypothetical protein